MLITPNQVFLDGGDRYEPGTEYYVPDDRAAYFDSQGWLASDDGSVSVSTPPETVELYVHDSSAGQSTEVL